MRNIFFVSLKIKFEVEKKLIKASLNSHPFELKKQGKFNQAK